MDFSRSGYQGSLPTYDSRSFNPFGQLGQSANGRVTANHLSNAIAPIQFERWAADIADWRAAMREMELAFFPFRTKSTRIYIDTMENVFVKFLMEKTKNMVLKRKPFIYQWKEVKGKMVQVISNDLTQQLNSNFWFEDYRSMVLDPIFWGFRLIELGDLDTSSENIFPELTFTRPENIRIDKWRGALLTSVPYYIDGIAVQDDAVIKMWNHYIPTKSNRGVSPCGYGMLYNISEYAIHLKHLLGWRLDFIENYGQPVRIGTTSKQGHAKKKFEEFLANPSANQYILLDRGTNDEVRLESAADTTGTAWKSHGDAAMFLKRELSQLVLGHEDAAITTPGKVGANVTSNKDGFNTSGMEDAMNEKQTAYSNYEIAKMNQISFPSFRKLAKFTGCKMLDFVPQGYSYGLVNDKEDQEVKRRFNADLQAKGTAFLSLYNAGLKPKSVEDVNAMFPEIPDGFVMFTPTKKLEEERDSNTNVTTDSLDKPNAKPGDKPKED